MFYLWVDCDTRGPTAATHPAHGAQHPPQPTSEAELPAPLEVQIPGPEGPRAGGPWMPGETTDSCKAPSSGGVWISWERKRPSQGCQGRGRDPKGRIPPSTRGPGATRRSCGWQPRAAASSSSISITTTTTTTTTYSSRCGDFSSQSASLSPTTTTASTDSTTSTMVRYSISPRGHIPIVPCRMDGATMHMPHRMDQIPVGGGLYHRPHRRCP